MVQGLIRKNIYILSSNKCPLRGSLTRSFPVQACLEPVVSQFLHLGFLLGPVHLKPLLFFRSNLSPKPICREKSFYFKTPNRGSAILRPSSLQALKYFSFLHLSSSQITSSSCQGVSVVFLFIIALVSTIELVSTKGVCKHCSCFNR